MNSFQAKIGWKMMGKRENKKLMFRFVSSRCAIENFKKIAKKFKKLKKKYHYDFISCQNRSEKSEKGSKYKLSFRSVPTRRVIENSKKRQKN